MMTFSGIANTINIIVVWSDYINFGVWLDEKWKGVKDLVMFALFWS